MTDGDSGSPSSVGRAFSPSHFFRWFTRRRAAWGVMIGLGLVVVMAAAGVVQLAVRRGPFVRSFYCADSSLQVYFGRTPLCSVATCSFVPPGARPTQPLPDTRVDSAFGRNSLQSHGVELPSSIIARVIGGTSEAESQYTVGVPFRSFAGEWHRPAGSLKPKPLGTTTRQLIATPLSQQDYLLIPYRPLPGLFYSWAFWSVLAYGLLSALAYTRITRRLAKGLCPKCAYDLGGAPRCPECGTIVRAAPTPATLSP